MPLRPFFTLALLVLLSGCALFDSRADRALKASPDYKAGYGDGCSTAGSQAGANSRANSMVRDEESYRTNPAYHAGWGTGFNACRMYQAPSTVPGLPGSGPVL